MRINRYTEALVYLLKGQNVFDLYKDTIMARKNLSLNQFLLKTAPNQWIDEAFIWNETPSLYGQPNSDSHELWTNIEHSWHDKIKKLITEYE